jgi:diaminopimelate decarboxylase
MLNLADHLFTDAPPGFLDLGGGFCGPMPHSLAEQLGDSPDYRSYAEQIAPLFAKRYGHNGATQLILEPGVGILGDVMRFFCEVVAIKELPQRSVAVTTGSYQNIKPSISRVKLPMSVLPASDRGGDPIVRELDLVGYTCMEDDILHPDYKGPLEVGDVVMFENAGAYSIVFKAPFIRGMPAIVCRDHERGCWRVLHRPQPLAAWLTGYSQTGAAR